MALYPDSQGTTATFAGFDLDGFVRFDTTPASCAPVEVTGVSANVVGAGISSRIVRQYHPGPIDPGTASVELLGTPVYDVLDTGMTGTLTIAGPWGSVSYEAFLAKVTVGGSVGELVRSTMEFQFL